MMYRNHNGEIIVGAEGADHDALLTKLGEARAELFDYERMVETCMINSAEHVVDEMVSEIKHLRKTVEYFADDENYFYAVTGECPVLDNGLKIAREALSNGEKSNAL